MTDKALDDFEMELRDHFADLVGMLVKKRQSYGPNNLMQFGGLGIVIRANDKIFRLAEMYQQGTERNADGEAMADAWRDLVGYAILGLLYHENRLTLDQKYKAGVAIKEKTR